MLVMSHRDSQSINAVDDVARHESPKVTNFNDSPEERYTLNSAQYVEICITKSYLESK